MAQCQCSLSAAALSLPVAHRRPAGEPEQCRNPRDAPSPLPAHGRCLLCIPAGICSWSTGLPWAGQLESLWLAGRVAAGTVAAALTSERALLSLAQALARWVCLAEVRGVAAGSRRAQRSSILSSCFQKTILVPALSPCLSLALTHCWLQP